MLKILFGIWFRRFCEGALFVKCQVLVRTVIIEY